MSKLLLVLFSMLFINSAFAKECTLGEKSLTFITKNQDVKLFQANNCTKIYFHLHNASYISQYSCTIGFKNIDDRTVQLDPRSKKIETIDAISGSYNYTLNCKVANKPEVMLSNDLKEKVKNFNRMVSFKNDFKDKSMKCKFLDEQSNTLAKTVYIQPNSWSSWVKNPTKKTKLDCITYN